MQMAQQVIRQVNCPNHCPEMKMGSDITSKVKIKDDYILKNGTASVYLQCFVKGTQVRVPTNIKVPPKQFNKVKERIRASHPQADDFNLILEEMLARVHEIRVKYRLGQIKLNPQVFKDMVLNSSINTDFLAYMNWKIDQRKTELAYGTYRHHRSTMGILKSWRSTLPFSNICEKLFFDFRKHLEAKGNNANTVGTKLKIIKTYLNAARADGFIFEMPEKSLKRLQVKSKVVALTSDELKRAIDLYRKQYLTDHHQQTLRCFLFSCFTGLRYSDVAQLNQEHIIGNYIIITPAKTKKTGKFVKIPLNAPAKSLLDLGAAKPLGKVISNVKMNFNLKVVAKYIGFENKLSFHASRHTFATMFLELGGSVEVLQTILGHSSIKQTMIYAHVVDKRREAQIDNFNRLL